MKNFYSLNAGEFFVAQELLRVRKDISLYFPLKDVGVDLLAIKNNGNKPVRIQVKESRTYINDNSWHQIRENKIQDADIFVFISYVQANKNQRSGFDKDYVVIPQADLKQICSKKKCSKGKYSFYFYSKKGQLLDFRDEECDLTRFQSAWNLI